MDQQAANGLIDLSVIMRAHDPSRLDQLAEAFSSVWMQNCESTLEVVLCLDGQWPELSAEGLLALGGSADLVPNGPRVLTIVSTVFAGDSRVHLLRLGIPKAQGRFIGFLDYDDVWFSQAARSLLERAQNDDAVVVFGACQLDLFRDDASRPFAQTLYSDFPFTVADVLGHNIAPFHSYIIRRDVVDASVRDLPDISLYEDYYLLLSALAQGDAAWISSNTPVCGYRVDVTVQAAKYREVQAKSLREIQELKARLSFGEAWEPTRLKATPEELSAMDASTVGEDASIFGCVEAIIPVSGGHHVEGWVVNYRTGAAPDTVFVKELGGATVVAPTRWARPDVIVATGCVNGRAGFAVTVPHNPESVFVMSNGKRFEIPLPGQASALRVRILGKLWSIFRRKLRRAS